MVIQLPAFWYWIFGVLINDDSHCVWLLGLVAGFWVAWYVADYPHPVHVG